VIVGIAAGELTQFNATRGMQERTEEVDQLFTVGNDLGWIGVWFLVASAATALAVVMRVGRRALPGAVVLLVAAVLFTGGSHIYWPAGVVTMLVLAVGLGLLAMVLPDPQPRGDQGVEGKGGSPFPAVVLPACAAKVLAVAGWRPVSGGQGTALRGSGLRPRQEPNQMCATRCA